MTANEIIALAKEEFKKEVPMIISPHNNTNDDAKILRQLAQQSIILVTQFDAIEKRLDKTIEILDKLLKLKKLEMGIYE